MTRRELLTLGINLLISLFFGRFLVGCRLLGGKKNITSQLAFLLGYLLYEDNPPVKGVEEIGKNIKTIVQSSLKEQLALELSSKMKNRSFEALSSEDKRNYFKEILPILIKHPEILDVLSKYLQGERVLEYLDYPDLPGEYGECGWMVLEGDVWDRCYPSSDLKLGN
jgi:hypothetical protein